MPSWLHSAPIRLPGVADRIAEGWWRLGPRARLTFGLLTIVVMTGVMLARVALSPYGPPVPVLITTDGLRAGDILTAPDVTARRWPRALVPAGALQQRPDAMGRRLTMSVTAGTVLTTDHVTDGGPLIDLASGAAAVPVPSGSLRGAVHGARLDLIVTLGDGTGRTLARDVRVLAEEAGTTWIEVERRLAPDVAAAAARGTLSAAVLTG